MKKEKLFDAIGEIDGDLAEAAFKDKQKKKKSTYSAKVAAVAACLVIAVIIGAVTYANRGGNTGLVKCDYLAYRISAAEYPEFATRPDAADYVGDNNGYLDAEKKWSDSIEERQALFEGMSEGFESFLSTGISTFSEEDGKNTVISPISIYIALGMIAEISEGDSREQVLAAAGVSSVEELRENCSAIWNTMYRDDKTSTVLFNSSIWMSNDLSYYEDVVSSLRDNYYVSSFIGKMGSEEYDVMFREWMNESTGGRLAEPIADETLDPRTAMELVNTVEFKARWFFSEELTEESAFYTRVGQVTAEFMKRKHEGIYGGDKFTAVNLGFLDESYSMWVVLPDEGYTPEELLTDEQTIELILHGKAESSYNEKAYVNLSLPKFDVSYERDLLTDFADMGITDVFEPTTADIRLVETAVDGFEYLNKANTVTSLKIDEEGCDGAAITVIRDTMDSVDDIIEVKEVDFTVDRPFIVAVVNEHNEYGKDERGMTVLTSQDNLPLFVGIINDPTAN